LKVLKNSASNFSPKRVKELLAPLTRIVRPRFLGASVVVIQQPAELAARHLGDQPDRTGFRPLAAQHRARRHPRDVVGEQQ